MKLGVKRLRTIYKSKVRGTNTRSGESKEEPAQEPEKSQGGERQDSEVTEHGS